MSWFDSVGIASLAKNALKEAQKQIDKALDIQDDNIAAVAKVDAEKSKTAPGTPVQAVPSSWKGPTSTTWGSFSGSFFENPMSSEMITTPPTSGKSPQSGSIKRQSIQSNSDSVDLVSPPTSPGLSSSSMTIQQSDSVEVISTPPSSDILSPMSDKSPDSVEILSCDEPPDEEEEDSMSFNTVMDETIVNRNDSNRYEVSSCSGSQNMIESFDLVRNAVEQNLAEKMSSVDSLLDSQTILSDSTQSFEEVHIPDCSTTSEDKELNRHVSERLSDQNSGDDIETTTSSDIEIISNPNGDSSSANSACRNSPTKASLLSDKKTKNELKIIMKGHYRIPSEVSTHSDDSSQTETDKLLLRVNELNDILEMREVQLLELSRVNASLQEKNIDVLTQLEAKKTQCKHIHSEEYTERLSALERKFQAAIREKDTIKGQLKSAQEELTTKMAKAELNKIVNEKEFLIAELRTEGDKLAKQVLQHSNIIKKLRLKEKDNDTVIKKNKEQIESLTEEVERLKKSLMAKEEMERSQIEAVHKLCSEKRNLEKDNAVMRNEIEDLNSKLKILQISFDAVKMELTKKQESHLELTRKAEILESVEKEKIKAQTDQIGIANKLEEMREKLKLAETDMSHRENLLRQANTALLHRLESSELRAEELTQEVSSSTIPLVRQLNSLQNTLESRTKNWEKTEKELLMSLESSQYRLKSLENINSSSTEELSLLTSRINNLEEKLSITHLKHEKVSASLQQAEIDFSLREDTYKREINDLTDKLNKLEETLCIYKENAKLQDDTNSTPVNICNPIAEISEKEHGLSRTGKVSPTNSLGHNSLSDSLGSSTWHVDDLECISNPGRSAGSVYGFNLSYVPVGHTASTLETLQSTLKQKDGEVCQLQWEISRLQSERSVFNSELVDLTIKLEQIKEQLESHERIKFEFSELQGQYDALLQMYGEKIEETQELELDLQDVKDMYKAQLDEILMLKSQSKK